jgi:hypothetical protein
MYDIDPVITNVLFNLAATRSASKNGHRAKIDEDAANLLNSIENPVIRDFYKQMYEEAQKKPNITADLYALVGKYKKAENGARDEINNEAKRIINASVKSPLLQDKYWTIYSTARGTGAFKDAEKDRGGREGLEAALDTKTTSSSRS